MNLISSSDLNGKFQYQHIQTKFCPPQNQEKTKKLVSMFFISFYCIQESIENAKT